MSPEIEVIKGQRQQNKEVPIAPRFADRCQEKLIELGLNPRQLAASVGKPYDTIRKACKGLTFPGPNDVLPLICNELGLDIEEMKFLINVDKIEKMGGIHLDALDPFLKKINDDFILLPLTAQEEIMRDVEKVMDRYRTVQD